jgi:RecJ-like exonuclease
MNTKTLFAVVLALFVTPVLAQTPTYTAVEAAKHIGETASVTDKVDKVSKAKGGNIFLNMGGAHPHEAFTAFISANLADKFPDFQKYEGATVTVTGKITSHNDKPQIELNSPDQITIKEATPDKTESPTASPSGT